MMDDTIAAITTAMGAAGVGIIRISGPEAAEVVEKVFRPKKKGRIREKPTYTITYGQVVDGEDVIDEALVMNMWKPGSYTGEDVVEIQCHGGTVVMGKILEMVIKAGARLAEPGEFSKRAFLNGKIDLTQAEAIMDIIQAHSEMAVKAAAANIRGTTAKTIKSVQADILSVLAYLEADIDFPEEDFLRLKETEIARKMEDTYKRIGQILDSYQSGKILKEGLKTALVGKPNVGKSSLLNALLREKRAIVTDIPGTTRDTIEEYYSLGGIPLILIDTAGLRETDDPVEKMGVEKTREAITGADLVLYVIDVLEGLSKEDIKTIKLLPRGKVILLINKIDLLGESAKEEETILQDIEQQLGKISKIIISAKEEIGLKELGTEITKLFFKNGLEIGQTALITNIRQKEALEQGREAVGAALESIKKGLPADFISIDLMSAYENLGKVTGETAGEDVIDQIFSQFCLGK